MKKIAISFALILMSIMTMNAQGKRYQGELLLGGVMGLNQNFGSRTEFCTTHGVIFDGRTFVGAGFGVNCDFAGSFEVPLYGSFSQSFPLSNYLVLGMGTSTGICMNQDEDFALYLAPEISFQISRVKFFFKYTYRNYLQGVTGGNEFRYDTSRLQCLSAGIGFIFGKK